MNNQIVKNKNKIKNFGVSTYRRLENTVMCNFALRLNFLQRVVDARLFRPAIPVIKHNYNLGHTRVRHTGDAIIRATRL